MADALQRDEPLSVVVLRLDHFQDTRDFLGPERSEELVRGVARRIQRRLASDDTAFRARGDAFVLSLPGRALVHKKTHKMSKKHHGRFGKRKSGKRG